MIGEFPRQAFLDLHERLALAPGPSGGEGPRRQVIETHLAGLGVAFRTDAAGNLWVDLGPPGSWADTLVLDAHMDVVERGSAERLLRENDCLVGLGVGDNLAAVAMLALALRPLAAAAPWLRRPLSILFSVGEEGLGNLRGVRQAVADHPGPPHLLVSFDGSLDTVALCGLGSRRYRVAVRCPGGHSWGNFGAPNACEVLIRFLAALREQYAALRQETQTVISFNIGTLAGGEGINSIARRAEATFEFRSAAPDLLAAMDIGVTRVLQESKRHPDIDIELACIGERPAADAVARERLEPLVRGLWEPVVGALRETVMSTNINVPLQAGWPAVCLGLCCVERTHREDETLHLNSLDLGWACLDRLCAAMLGTMAAGQTSA